MKKVLVAVLLLVVIGAIGQTGKSSQPVKQPTAAATQQNRAGKYQIFFSPHARADVYLLDTETGQIWTPVTISNAKDANLKTAPQVWLYQDRIDTETQFDIWSAMHTPQPTPTAQQ